ncbi:MAG: hypothetical protein Q9209_006106, partial [Squamulea sp. 1 TL-2023]
AQSSKRNRSISAYNNQELRSKRKIRTAKPGPNHDNCDFEAEASKYKSLGDTSEIFPNLENIAEFLISLVHDSNDPRTAEYKALLQKVGDRQRLQQFLLDCIEKEVLSLEGTRVRPESLRHILDIQKHDQSLMKQAGGYLDFVTDDRDVDYCRFYVGQSTGLEARMSEHSKEIYSGSVKSLHYYICALGNGHRTPNFIRLFTLTESKATEISISNEHDMLLLLNLLETINAVGFRSLPKGLLARFLPTQILGPRYASIHFNVANPLDQGTPYSERKRLISRTTVQDSADLEIRNWPQFRKQDIKHRSSERVRYPSSQEYQLAFETSLRNQHPRLVNAGFLFWSSEQKLLPKRELIIETSCKNCCEAIRNKVGMPDVDLRLPYGSLTGCSIAIVYGSPMTTPGSSVNGDCDSSSIGLPYALAGTGLTQYNSLVWPLDLRTNTTIDQELSSSCDQLYSHLAELSISIIDASNAKIVFVSGTLARKCIIEGNDKKLIPVSVKLGSEDLQCHLEVEDGDKSIRRIYLEAPDLWRVAQGFTFKATVRMSLGLRLASIITGLKEIDYNWYINWSVRVHILRLKSTVEDRERLTIEDLNDFVKNWLWQKGFEDQEAISELVKTSGQPLATAIHMLYVAIPRKRSGIPNVCSEIQYDVRSVPRKIRKERAYDTCAIQAIRELFDCSQKSFASRVNPLGESRHIDSRDGMMPRADDDRALVEAPLSMANVNDDATESSEDEFSYSLGLESIISSEKRNTLEDETLEDIHQATIDGHVPFDPGLAIIDHSLELNPKSPLSSESAITNAELLGSSNSRMQPGVDADKCKYNNDRIRYMIIEGVRFKSMHLKMANQVLRWDFREQFTDRVPHYALGVCIWLEVTDDIHARPWYTDSARPDLQRFAFKVGLPFEQKDQARYFRPGVKERGDGQYIQEDELSLAETIMRIANSAEVQRVLRIRSAQQGLVTANTVVAKPLFVSKRRLSTRQYDSSNR